VQLTNNGVMFNTGFYVHFYYKLISGAKNAFKQLQFRILYNQWFDENSIVQ